MTIVSPRDNSGGMTGDDLRARRITAPASERAGHQNPSDPLMAALETLKYRAFLSYSHRDSAAAKRLHTRLEGFLIDKDLVGRATSMGLVPKQLRPIFRDRHDFDAGGTLG